MEALQITNTTVKEVGGMYLITADSGYCIHLPEHEEFMYKGAVALQPTYDFIKVKVVAVADLPEGAKIL